jgi:hypothetical protein
MSRKFEPNLRSMIIAFVIGTAVIAMWSIAGEEAAGRKAPASWARK